MPQAPGSFTSRLGRIPLFVAVLVAVLPASSPRCFGFDPGGVYRRAEVTQLALSFEIPAEWVSGMRDGIRTWQAPGENPEAVLSIQMIDNRAGESSIAEQVAKLRNDLEGLSGVEFLADEENSVSGLRGHTLIGRYQANPGVETGMVWAVVSRSEYFYWIGLTFPPAKWEHGYATLMDRVVDGMRFTALYEGSIQESNQVARKFLYDVRQGNLDSAYQRSNEIFRTNTSRTDFESYLDGLPVWASFNWFRVLENTGSFHQRVIQIELEGPEPGEVPMLTLVMDGSEGGVMKVHGMVLSKGLRITSDPTVDAPPGFASFSTESGGFSGVFPEGWIVLREDLTAEGVRYVFRPPAGGFTRNRDGIILYLDPGEIDPSELLNGYIETYSASPGFVRRGEEFAHEVAGLQAVGAVYRSETEDDQGLFISANTVTVVRSPSGFTALLHLIMDGEESAESFEATFQPVLEHLRLLK